MKYVLTSESESMCALVTLRLLSMDGTVCILIHQSFDVIHEIHQQHCFNAQNENSRSEIVLVNSAYICNHRVASKPILHHSWLIVQITQAKVFSFANMRMCVLIYTNVYHLYYIFKGSIYKHSIKST